MSVLEPRHRSPVARIIALVVALAAIGIYVGGRAERNTSSKSGQPVNPYVGPEPHADDDVIALLDGLKPGDEIGGLEVLAIDAPIDRVVRVDVGTATKVFSVSIRRLGSGGDKVPPVTTDKYEITYGCVRGEGELPSGVMRDSAGSIAERIRRRELEVAVPAGM